MSLNGHVIQCSILFSQYSHNCRTSIQPSQATGVVLDDEKKYQNSVFLTCIMKLLLTELTPFGLPAVSTRARMSYAFVD